MPMPVTVPAVIRRLAPALALALVAPASAQAASTLSYPVAGGQLTVSATAADPAVTIAISQAIVAVGPPTISIQSQQGLSVPAGCIDPLGDGTLVRCPSLPSTVVVVGTEGADTITSGGTGPVPCASAPTTIDGLGGADELRGGCANDVLRGGAGRDTLDGGGGNDDLDGGADADAVDGSTGDDVLRGGDGRDLLSPGRGRDVILGGGSIDTVSYEERLAALTLAIGGGPDDGEPGEGDTISDDVENVVGGSGNDAITGSATTNDVDGGPGNDTINPGGGSDVVEGGPGNDVVLARDGVQDRVVCGDGADSATVDAFETLEGCESVAASRELMPDVDNDGLPAPADCNDADPGIRPGLPDRPGDRVDGDCVGGDAAYPRVLSGWTHAFRYGPRNRFIRYTKLEIIDVPDRATIEMVCRGAGCFRGVRRSRHARGATRVNLVPRLRSRRLRARSLVEVRVTRPETVGKIFRFRTQRGRRDPVVTILCRRPGTRAPHSCTSRR